MMPTISIGSIPEIGRSPMTGMAYFSMLTSHCLACPAVHMGDLTLWSSRARFLKLCSETCKVFCCACFVVRLIALGSPPFASSLRASSRRSRAWARVMSGYSPVPGFFVFRQNDNPFVNICYRSNVPAGTYFYRLIAFVAYP